MDAQNPRQDGCATRARFLSDLRTRCPGRSGADPARPGADPAAGPPDSEFTRRLGRLPTETGVLLMVVGIAGLLLPGPVGSPFVLAGGLVLWPKGFGRAEAWFERRCPGLHREGVAQIGRYLSDMERRYPGTLR